MGEHSVQQLLPQQDHQLFYTPNITVRSLSSVKWVLRIIIWLLFLAWVVSIFLYSLDPVLAFVKTLTHDSIETFLGIAGPVLLIYSGPILVIAFLAAPYLIISGKEQLQGYKTPSYRLSTFPLLVNRQFGVISAAEFIGIAPFVIYIIWAVCVHMMRNLATMNAGEFSSLYEKCSFLLRASGISVASIGIFCLAFLFISIARGSILLRLIDIPFGHAVRYHSLLGHLSIFLFALHGLFYIIVWSMDGTLVRELLKWQGTDENNLAGVIGLSAALLIWITSLPPVRRKYFELFFYTHQLYIVVVIFLALHAGIVYFSMIAAAIFLFMLDRFLRFCQSRKTVDIVSAACFPGTGIVKLVLPKPQNLQHNALSFVFIQIPVISGCNGILSVFHPVA